MEKLPLDRLFAKKLDLHNAKYKHIYNIFYNKRNYLDVYHSVLKLKDLIRSELQINQRILRKINRLYRKGNQETSHLEPLEKATNSLMDLLKEEYAIIRAIGPFSLLKHDYKVLFSKNLKRSYLTKQCLEFKEVFDKELEINKDIIEELYKKNIELYGLKQIKQRRKKFLEAKDLLLEAQSLLKAFVKSIGNNEGVQRTGKELLSVLDAFQNTDLYEFVHQDVQAIKKKVKYVMAHPKQHKLTYLFTGIYLVSPGTFELTGAILTLRYMTKYTIKKTKGLKQNSRERSIRRKVKRNIKRKQPY